MKPSLKKAIRRLRSSGNIDYVALSASPVYQRRLHRQAAAAAQLGATSTGGAFDTTALLERQEINSPVQTNSLSCVGSFTMRKPKELVTVLVGKEMRVFKVEPQFLEHGLFQSLLRKTGRTGYDDNWVWYEKENNSTSTGGGSAADCFYGGGRKSSAAAASSSLEYLRSKSLCVDCDAILFEHILWLLNNDDPSARHLNLDELMEFYS